MTKNPLLNALSATLYITIVATIMINGEQLFGNAKSVVIPIAVISLFSLFVSSEFFNPLEKN